MFKPATYAIEDALIINHVLLRAPDYLQAPAQQQLLNIDFPEQPVGEYLFFREVKLRQKHNHFKIALQVSLKELSEQAVDGCSRQADGAVAVRFKSLGQLLAQLTQDIIFGRQAAWYWESWKDLFSLPVAEALIKLWTEHISDLTDMVQALDEQNKLTRVWKSLSEEQVKNILSRLKLSLGINNIYIKEIVDDGYSKTLLQSIPKNAFMPWSGLAQEYGIQKSHMKLAAIFILLRWRGDSLCQAQAEENISSIVKALESKAAYVEKKIQPKNQIQTELTNLENINNAQRELLNNKIADVTVTKKKAKLVRKKTIYDKNENTKLLDNKQEKDDSALKTSGEINDSMLIDKKNINLTDDNQKKIISCVNNNEILINKEKSVLKNENNEITIKTKDKKNIVSPVKQVLAQKETIPEEEISSYKSEEYCYIGGIFYLLNFMARSPTQALLKQYNAYDNLNGAWGCLYRLADVLGRRDDRVLDQFIASRLGLDNVSRLSDLPLLDYSDKYNQLAEKLYGPKLWNASLLLMPAQIQYSPSHLDIYYSLKDVKLGVRKAGLDINPGWLPWLGQVVNFHYHDSL